MALIYLHDDELQENGDYWWLFVGFVDNYDRLMVVKVVMPILDRANDKMSHFVHLSWQKG